MKPPFPARYSRWVSTAALCCLAAGAAGCFASQKDVLQARAEARASQARMEALEAEIHNERLALQGRIIQADAKIGEMKDLLLAENVKAFRAAADVGNEVDRLREDNARLRGSIEVLEKRLNDLETRGAAVPAPPAAAAPPPVREEIRRPDNDREFHKLIQNMYGLKQFGTTRRLAKEFLETFPKSNLADDVLMIAGDSWFDEKNYLEAVNQYSEIYKKYKNADQTALALYRIGLSFESLDKQDKALASYTLCVEEFRKSPAAAKCKGRLAQISKKKTKGR